MHKDIGHPHRRWQNRALIRERDKRDGRWLWSIVLGVVLALLPAGVYQIAKNECVKLTYELNHLRTRTEAMLEKERRLRVDRARLESLSVIEAWAANSAQLVRADDKRTLVVDRDTSSGELVVRGPGPQRTARKDPGETPQAAISRRSR